MNYQDIEYGLRFCTREVCDFCQDEQASLCKVIIASFEKVWQSLNYSLEKVWQSLNYSFEKV